MPKLKPNLSRKDVNEKLIFIIGYYKMNFVSGDDLHCIIMDEDGNNLDSEYAGEIKKLIDKTNYSNIKINLECRGYEMNLSIVPNNIDKTDEDFNEIMNGIIIQIMKFYLKIKKSYNLGILSGRIRYNIFICNGIQEGTINAGSENDVLQISHLFFYNRCGTVELNKMELVEYLCNDYDNGAIRIQIILRTFHTPR